MKRVFKINGLNPEQLRDLRAGFMLVGLILLIETCDPEIDYEIAIELFLGSLKPEIVERFIKDERAPSKARTVWEKMEK